MRHRCQTPPTSPNHQGNNENAPRHQRDTGTPCPGRQPRTDGARPPLELTTPSFCYWEMIMNHIHTYIHTYIRTYVHTYIHIYIYCMYVCTYVRMYVCTYVRTYALLNTREFCASKAGNCHLSKLLTCIQAHELFALTKPSN